MSDWKNNPPKYVIVSPVRNEEKFLEGTIKSVVSQTVKPVEWILVDDGSTDGTAAIIDRYAEQSNWIRPVHRANRGFRQSGGGVMEAFNDGYKALLCKDWDFVVKLDGDLTFEPDYFEKLLDRFMAEPALGITGGTLYSIQNGEMTMDRNPRFHVRGATKIYRRECWEQIGGLWPAPGWDTIDETSANMRGWVTMSIPEVLANHHRPTGSADGSWRDSVKHGLACYIAGYHPLYLVASSFYRLLRRPYPVPFVGGFYGFLRGYFNHIPKVDDPALIKFVRKQQLKRLMGQETIWR